MFNKKGLEISNLPGTIVSLVIAIIIFVMGLIIISSINDSVSFSPAGFIENVLLSNNTKTSLTHTPISISATIKNLTWLNFTNDRVRIDENINFTNNFSISFWFKKPTTTDTAGNFLICKSDVTENNRAWQFHANSGNDIWFLTYPNGTNTNITTSQLNNFVNADTWYNVVGTYDQNSIRLYLNGLLGDNDTVIADPIKGARVFDGISNVTLGNCQSNAGFYNGSLDEVMIFNKTLSAVEVTDLYLNGHTNQILPNQVAGYYDDFSSYAVGNDTIQPKWIPQYSDTVNITSDKTMQIDGFYNGGASDRDLHAELNVSQISRGIQNLTISYQFNTTNCNSSFFDTESVSNIAAATYLYYTDGNNFLSIEIKTNASAETCGTGQAARFTIYKRDAGTTTALNPTTYYNFTMNTTHNVIIIFKTHNASNYNLSASVENSLGEIIRVSNITIAKEEVTDGTFILESAGTTTKFDNVNITRNYVFPTPAEWWRLNENSGTKVYDRISSYNGTSEAEWLNNAINIPLLPTDYKLLDNNFTLNNNLYSWTQIVLNYDYNGYGEAKLSINNSLVGLAEFSSFVPIIIIAIVASVVIGLILLGFVSRGRQR